MRNEQQFIMGGGIKPFTPKKALKPGELVDAMNYEQAPEGGYRLRKGSKYHFNMFRTGGDLWIGETPSGDGFNEDYHIRYFTFDHKPNDVHFVFPQLINGSYTNSSLPDFPSNIGVTVHPMLGNWSTPTKGTGIALILNSAEHANIGPFVGTVNRPATVRFGSRPAICVQNFYGNRFREACYIGMSNFLYEYRISNDTGTPSITQRLISIFDPAQAPIREIGRFRDHLVVMMDGHLWLSDVGNPDSFIGSTSLEIGLPAQHAYKTKLVEYQGALFYALQDGVYVLRGQTTENLTVEKVASLNPIWIGVVNSQLLVLDSTKGLVTISATDMYGDFIPSELGQDINRTVTAFLSKNRYEVDEGVIYYNRNTKQLNIWANHNQLVNLPTPSAGLAINFEGQSSVMPLRRPSGIMGVDEVLWVELGVTTNRQTRYFGTEGKGSVMEYDVGNNDEFHARGGPMIGTGQQLKYDYPVYGWMITVPYPYGSPSQFKIFKSLSVDVDLEDDENLELYISSYSGDKDVQGMPAVLDFGRIATDLPISTDMLQFDIEYFKSTYNVTDSDSLLAVLTSSNPAIPGISHNIRNRYKPTLDQRINYRGKNMGLVISCRRNADEGHTITGATVKFSPRRRQR